MGLTVGKAAAGWPILSRAWRCEGSEQRRCVRRLSQDDQDAAGGRAIVGLIEGKDRSGVAYPEQGLEVYCLPAGRLSGTLLHAARAASQQPGSVPEALGQGQLLLLLVYRKAPQQAAAEQASPWVPDRASQATRPWPARPDHLVCMCPARCHVACVRSAPAAHARS